MALIASVIPAPGITRMLFDCRDANPDPASELHLAAMIAEAARRNTAPPGDQSDHAASAFSTSRPVTLPSRSRISAS